MIKGLLQFLLVLSKSDLLNRCDVVVRSANFRVNRGLRSLTLLAVNLAIRVLSTVYFSFFFGDAAQCGL